MPPPREQATIASLFDRLTDERPMLSRDAPVPSSAQRKNYQDGVARDLTNLLNSRRNEKDIPEEFKYTRESLIAYGIQDFTSAPMDREEIRRSIERTIRIFEPRLARVQVSLVKTGIFQVAFRITCLLRTNAGMEPVVYDADLVKDARRIRVTVGR